LFLTENSKLVLAGAISLGSGAITGDWISLKGYGACRCHVILTRGADSTAAAITLDKAKTVAGGDESAGMTIKNWYSLTDYVPGTSTATDLTKGTAATSISTDTSQSVTHYYVLDVDASELGEGYDCLQVNLAASNAANYQVAFYELYNPRYAEDAGGVVEPIDN